MNALNQYHDHMNSSDKASFTVNYNMGNKYN